MSRRPGLSVVFSFFLFSLFAIYNESDASILARAVSCVLTGPLSKYLRRRYVDKISDGPG